MTKDSKKKRHLLYSFCMLLIAVLLTTACGGGNSKTTPVADANPKKSDAINYEAMSVQELEVGAKKEGKLVWYAAMETAALDAVSKKFMAKYPEIKMEYIAIDSQGVPTRVSTEQKGGKYNADVITASGWPIQQLKQAKALEKYVSPEAKGLDKGTVDPEGYWAAHFSLTFPIAYNPKKVKELGLQPPKSYEDLTKPEWKGNFAMDRTDYEWYASMLKSLGEKGKKLTEDLSKNKPQLRLGHTVALQGLIAGEYAATTSAFGYRADMEKTKGEPVEFFNPNPTITLLAPAAIAKNAPHPYAARLFETWLLSVEGQKIMFEVANRTPTRKGVVDSSNNVYDPSKYNYFYSDPSSGNEYENIVKEFNKVFGIGG